MCVKAKFPLTLHPAPVTLINKMPQGHQRWPFSFWLKHILLTYFTYLFYIYWLKIYFTSQNTYLKARPSQRSSHQWWPTWNNPTHRQSLFVHINTALPISSGLALETTASSKLRSSRGHIPKHDQLWLQWRQKKVFLLSQNSTARANKPDSICSSTGQKCMFRITLTFVAEQGNSFSVSFQPSQSFPKVYRLGQRILTNFNKHN